MSKYKKWHDNIIKKALERNWTKRNSPYYVEKHHIIPKSLGGTNNKTNLVCLTAKEHYIVHLLLTKIGSQSEKEKMRIAFFRLCFGNKQHFNFISPRRYEMMKKEYSNLQKRRLLGKGNPFFGKTHSEEFKEKQRNNRLGKKISEEAKKNYPDQSGSNNGMFGKFHTEKTKLLISKNRQGKLVGKDNPFWKKQHSYETKMRISAANKGKYGARSKPVLYNNQVFNSITELSMHLHVGRKKVRDMIILDKVKLLKS